ncbi:MarR family transcriptional regulator [Mycobacterium sp. NPDC006124]|uniref:MarR family winged helix-turn-helix transcriptional regulator n=1 Tax=Mycobacterium sp. NPDC006124 TaxID=3156729 RepID=UPI0033AAF3C7
MQEQPDDRSASDGVGGFLDQVVDLTARFLTDRTDMSASALFVVNRLCREGPLRLTTLATKEGISQPSMTQLITRLERQGFVCRIADPEDGRVTLVGITERGQEAVADRRHSRRERLAELLGTLSPDERKGLQLSAHVALPILRRLAASADEPPHDDPRKASQ